MNVSSQIILGALLTLAFFFLLEALLTFFPVYLTVLHSNPYYFPF